MLGTVSATAGINFQLWLSKLITWQQLSESALRQSVLSVLCLQEAGFASVVSGYYCWTVACCLKYCWKNSCVCFQDSWKQVCLLSTLLKTGTSAFNMAENRCLNSAFACYTAEKRGVSALDTVESTGVSAFSTDQIRSPIRGFCFRHCWKQGVCFQHSWKQMCLLWHSWNFSLKKEVSALDTVENRCICCQHC